MAPMPELNPDALRFLVRQRMTARSHWIVLLSDDERGHLSALLAAIDAAQPPDGAPVRIDLWAVELYAVDADDGTPADLGSVLFVSWPRPALPIERLHAILARLFGQALPVAQLLECPILVPVARAHRQRTGPQLHALQDWLLDEEDV
jgi:hypothetical protein